MGQINVVGIEYALSDGRVLLNDVSFRVGDGSKVALIGPNGSGKTTLFRMIAGDLQPDAGQIIINGGLGVMRQFIGSIRDASTVRDLLVSVSPLRIRSRRGNGTE
jgi:ABC-type multidrug transport system ATPase subunit